jgi:hypothetical protein
LVCERKLSPGIRAGAHGRTHRGPDRSWRQDAARLAPPGASLL